MSTPETHPTQQMPPGRRSFDWTTPRVIVALAAVAVLLLAVPAWADMLENDDGSAPGMAVPAQPPSVSPHDGSRYVVPAPPPPGAPQAVPLPDRGEMPAPPPPGGSDEPGQDGQGQR